MSNNEIDREYYNFLEFIGEDINQPKFNNDSFNIFHFCYRDDNEKVLRYETWSHVPSSLENTFIRFIQKRKKSIFHLYNLKK